MELGGLGNGGVGGGGKSESSSATATGGTNFGSSDGSSMSPVLVHGLVAVFIFGLIGFAVAVRR